MTTAGAAAYGCGKLGVRAAGVGIEWVGDVVERSGKHFEIIQVEGDCGETCIPGMRWSF